MTPREAQPHVQCKGTAATQLMTLADTLTELVTAGYKEVTVVVTDRHKTLQAVIDRIETSVGAKEPLQDQYAAATVEFGGKCGPVEYVHGSVPRTITNMDNTTNYAWRSG